ncbi:MAG: hypothetical protein KAT90_00935, partial [Gammaproteobacteria bacterium]|nr:hypothetical protein [Gammaproteobacteria bacterium]
CGIAGFYGVTKLSESLKYVTGPAWDSADGAMEGSIGIQAEMLVIKEVFAGLADMNFDAERKKHSNSAKEALTRMKAASLIEDAVVRDLIATEKYYATAADKVVEEFKTFSVVDKRLAVNFHDLQILMTQAEVLGDGTVEELRDNPNKSISWNTGLRQKWEAADGAMMSQIGMLKTMYFYRRMLAFENFQQSFVGMKEGDGMLQEVYQSVIQNRVFAKNHVSNGVYKGQTFTSAITQAVGKHRTDFAEAVEEFKHYSTSRQAYEQTSSAMLEILEKTEEVGDQTVEAEMGNITAVINFADGMIVFVLIIAVLTSLIMGLLIVRSVNTQLGRDPAELMAISEAMANGNLDIKIDNNAIGVYGSIG